MKLIPSFVVLPKQQFLVIISGHRLTGSMIGNGVNHIAIGQGLQDCGFEFEEVDGKYKGREEIGYAVVCHNLEQVEGLKLTAREYAQESILVVNSQREAYLVFTDRKKPEEYIGRWEQVHKSDAMKGDYTHRNGHYFSVDFAKEAL